MEKFLQLACQIRKTGSIRGYPPDMAACDPLENLKATLSGGSHTIVNIAVQHICAVHNS
jgi:hypothetical protein